MLDIQIAPQVETGVTTDKVMPTYHPSSTIYTPKNRDILKEDLQTVATLLIEGF